MATTAKAKLAASKNTGAAAVKDDHKHDWAKMAISPSVASAAASENFGKAMFPDMDLSDLVKELQISIKAVQSGDMSGMEAMLVGQAHALQTVFVSLLRRGHAQDYLKQYGVYMGLALKAQAQSRATIQALVELKYPKQVVITKQANISNGPQQVNNGAHAHAVENQNEQTKLLSGDSHAAMDTSGTAAAIGVNQKMEAVGAIHRP